MEGRRTLYFSDFENVVSTALSFYQYCFAFWIMIMFVVALCLVRFDPLLNTTTHLTNPRITGIMRNPKIRNQKNSSHRTTNIGIC